MAKLNDSEVRILDDVAAWKSENPSFLNRATDFVSKPISWLTDKLTPEEVKTSVAGVTERIVEKLHDASSWSVNSEDVLKASQDFGIEAGSIADLRKAPIQSLDSIAQSFITQNTRMGTISGVGTGLVGWPGLIADLPALFVLSLRQIYQIALSYGYDPKVPDGETKDREFEMEYMMRVFKISTASDKIQKQKGLSELKDFEAGRHSEVYNEVMGDYTTKQIGKSATSFVSRIVIKEIVERTITKKAVGLVPGLGAVFSGGFNYVYLQDVGDAAFMLYRERYLLDKKGRQRSIRINIE